jgi:hypothetical protein
MASSCDAIAGRKFLPFWVVTAMVRVGKELTRKVRKERGATGLTDIPISYDPPTNFDVGFGFAFAKSAHF